MNLGTVTRGTPLAETDPLPTSAEAVRCHAAKGYPARRERSARSERLDLGDGIVDVGQERVARGAHRRAGRDRPVGDHDEPSDHRQGDASGSDGGDDRERDQPVEGHDHHAALGGRSSNTLVLPVKARLSAALTLSSLSRIPCVYLLVMVVIVEWPSCSAMVK